MSGDILIGGTAGQQLSLKAGYANRHGLIAGATGTGKTVTLQVLAEGFSRLGVPVFLADVKGDLSGLCCAGTPHHKIDERLQSIGITDFQQASSPVAFWDLFGERGIPVRSTISEMGPQLLAALLELNETQESILILAFEFADDEGLLLVDLNDLRTTLSYLAEHGRELGSQFAVSKASVNAILRRLLMIEREGGDLFFGEPALSLNDLLRTDRQGRGVINILSAERLIQSPRLYSTFLLWLLSELFEQLPEIGDPEQPELVFFFDEAHLLFNSAPKALLEKIEQLVRLIRSKGVGVYFITQSPADIPDSVLGQLGNRIQHALRAYTPKEQKAVRVAAQSFRPNPELDTEAAISVLGVGEALVSVLSEGGVPTPVQRLLIAPPASRIGPAQQQERDQVLGDSPLQRRYGESFDPESAHEELLRRVERQEQNEQRVQAEESRRRNSAAGRTGRSRESAGEAFLKSLARSAGSSVGRRLLRGLLGSLLK
ncbi:helicase HerA-like domain-containing protein [Marinobacterium sp. YM272]|uniref:helicase HerA-like domain-containing protein n=1 Tax=Marinobacterium sp. YM272 TaxID=3421654 RepID=UPI003D7F2363